MKQATKIASAWKERYPNIEVVDLMQARKWLSALNASAFLKHDAEDSLEGQLSVKNRSELSNRAKQEINNFIENMRSIFQEAPIEDLLYNFPEVAQKPISDFKPDQLVVHFSKRNEANISIVERYFEHDIVWRELCAFDSNIRTRFKDRLIVAVDLPNLANPDALVVPANVVADSLMLAKIHDEFLEHRMELIVVESLGNAKQKCEELCFRLYELKKRFETFQDRYPILSQVNPDDPRAHNLVMEFMAISSIEFIHKYGSHAICMCLTHDQSISATTNN
jgi:hypothetical protein